MATPWSEIKHKKDEPPDLPFEGRVLFSLPPAGPTRILIGQRADRMVDTNVVEVNWYLEVTREGEDPVTFCLPKDFDRLWRMINP